MYYEKRTQEIAYFKDFCPLCGTKATLKLFAQCSDYFFILPWWSTTYYITCGNCFNTFKISREEKEKITRLLNENINELREEKHCLGCGTAYHPGQRFCGNCGLSLPQEAFKESRHKINFWEIALVVIIAIVFIVCGILLLNEYVLK